MVVRVGLEQLLLHPPEQLRNQRVGLVTHPAAVRDNLCSAVDALQHAGIQITALFSPEHGLSGAVADGKTVPNSVDMRSRLPVFSLYGDTKSPSETVLKGLDVLIFDMQDVGVRFYTFISTLFYVIESAAHTGTPIVVLDRPNPINGVTLEGPILSPAYTSFVGIVPIPIRYGLTIGELARYMNTELGFGADLTVIPMQNWHRSMWFDDTGLSWIPTSPAMPHTSTTMLYPGMCLLEGTNLSEGRGTALPFEICGAPWIDGYRLATYLNTLGLDGVTFRPTQFMPGTPGRYAGDLCGGVQAHITDRKALRPVAMGLHLIAAVSTLYPDEFSWQERSWEGTQAHFDLLMGTGEVRGILDTSMDIKALVGSWTDDLTQFEEACRPYLLYM